MIDTADHSRFRISQEDLPVVWDQLKPLNNFGMRLNTFDSQFTVNPIERDGGDEVYEYVVDYSPFRITQYTNGKISSQTKGSPYFENGSTSAVTAEGDKCFGDLASRTKERSGMDIYG